MQIQLKPTEKPRRKPIGQIIHEKACEIQRLGKPWLDLKPETRRQYARIAKAVEREVIKRLEA